MRSAIRLGWTDWRHRLTLIAVWLLYRFVNMLGCRLNLGNCTCDEMPVMACVDSLAACHHKFTVWNISMYDGRVYTLMVTQVCSATGKFNELPRV